jgi:CTP synthase (UTP-ammonia lyase)
MQGCGLFVGTGKFCQGCGFNRSIHRRWCVIDGGKKGRETMSATSEAMEIATAEHARAVALVGKAVELGDNGVAYVNVPDAERWAALKAQLGVAVKVIGNIKRVCESMELKVGAFALHVQGPVWVPTYAEWSQMVDQRERDQELA